MATERSGLALSRLVSIHLLKLLVVPASLGLELGSMEMSCSVQAELVSSVQELVLLASARHPSSVRA